jgi:lipopolysaccharide transport system ATP-binding protein
MSDLAIRARGLSKRYQIGRSERHGRYKTLQEDLLALPSRLWSAAGGHSAGPEMFWALKDVSFEVKQGEVLGIIGRNGAGKSTLLKILANITEPTTGRAEIYGRVGSLLEVGTGFHQELTGRENVYLSGAILGMTHREVQRKFDEIVDFAGVEKFIDTPAKHYSIGMYLRLAFAVAAHLEPEILLVDEVLAVGDAEFQKKCLGKMGEVAQAGRTVLFVSHLMPAIERLCQYGLLLSEGTVQYLGSAKEAVRQYLASGDLASGIVDLSMVRGRLGSGELRLTHFWAEDRNGRRGVSIASGEPCALVVEYASRDGKRCPSVAMSVHINTQLGMPVSLINTFMLNQDFAEVPPRGRIRLDIPQLPLTAGRYVVDLNIATHAGLAHADFIKEAAAFDVIAGDFYGTGRPGDPGAPVMLRAHWSLDAAPASGSREPVEFASGN